MDKLYKLIDEIREYGENNSVPIMSREHYYYNTKHYKRK